MWVAAATICGASWMRGKLSIHWVQLLKRTGSRKEGSFQQPGFHWLGMLGRPLGTDGPQPLMACNLLPLCHPSWGSPRKMKSLAILNQKFYLLLLPLVICNFVLGYKCQEV